MTPGLICVKYKACTQDIKRNPHSQDTNRKEKEGS